MLPGAERRANVAARAVENRAVEHGDVERFGGDEVERCARAHRDADAVALERQSLLDRRGGLAIVFQEQDPHTGPSAATHTRYNGAGGRADRMTTVSPPLVAAV